MANKLLVRLILVSAILPTLTLAAWLAKPSALHLATRAEAAEMSQDEFERRVHDYLLAHPELVGEALYRLQEKQDAEDAAAGRAVLKAHAAEVFDDADSPVSGNPKGDVTVVEFFDYNCPYCKVMAPVMEQAQAADPKLRIVYKEFPVLGPGSVFAAKAALAANKQGKYTVFHHALYQARGQVDEAKVLEVAAAVDLDIDRLKADMKDSAINGDLDKNTKLGELLHITGTPGFVVGDQVATGATELKNFQALIAKARAGHEAAK
ncbi:MAG: DsbA family protein [Xanthobacteraceae bacterium]